MANKSRAHTLEYILLGLIREEPSHGYALFDRVKNSPELSLIWQVKRSKLYYLLEKSENEGYLNSSTSSEGPYPERKIYEITDLGKEVLESWLHTPVRSSRYVRLAFLSKLYFLIREEGKAARELIDLQIQVCKGWQDSLYQKQESIGRNEFISNQVYQFRIGQIRAMLDWLMDCRDSLPKTLN
jgi:DNA-binding PadR family transcriptional regulator